MVKAILTFNKMPKACNDCRLFVSPFGSPAYCSLGAEYTQEEIDAEKDGNLFIYYHGYLPNRPKSCPLKESEDN